MHEFNKEKLIVWETMKGTFVDGLGVTKDEFNLMQSVWKNVVLCDWGEEKEKQFIEEMKKMLRERYAYCQQQVKKLYIDNDHLRQSAVDYAERKKNLAKIALYRDYENRLLKMKVRILPIDKWITWSSIEYIQKQGIKDFIILNGGEAFFKLYEKTN